MTEIESFGQWRVYDYGIVGLMPSVSAYDLTKADILSKTAEGWISHMAEKNWVNLGEFTAALEFYRKYFIKD